MGSGGTQTLWPPGELVGWEVSKHVLAEFKESLRCMYRSIVTVPHTTSSQLSSYLNYK